MEIKLTQTTSFNGDIADKNTVISLLLPDVRYPSIKPSKEEEIHISVETANKLLDELSRLLSGIPF